MKRSEMVNIISNVIADYIQSMENKTIYYPDYEMGQYVLTQIQIAGMQPPVNDTGTFDNSWEPEE